MEYFRLRGIGVSPGIAIGEVQLTERVIFTSRKESIKANQVEKELRRLKSTKPELFKITEEEQMGKLTVQIATSFIRWLIE